MKILATLLSPTAGTDVVANLWEVRRHSGMVAGGESSGYGLLPTGRRQKMNFARGFRDDRP